VLAGKEAEVDECDRLLRRAWRLSELDRVSALRESDRSLGLSPGIACDRLVDPELGQEEAVRSQRLGDARRVTGDGWHLVLVMHDRERLPERLCQPKTFAAVALQQALRLLIGAERHRNRVGGSVGCGTLHPYRGGSPWIETREPGLVLKLGFFPSLGGGQPVGALEMKPGLDLSVRGLQSCFGQDPGGIRRRAVSLGAPRALQEREHGLG
jgi:hypothetical protein